MTEKDFDSLWTNVVLIEIGKAIDLCKTSDLEMGNIDLSGMPPEHFAELKKQIRHISKTRDKRDKIRITPKDILRRAEHLGYSPDLADAVVAWNWVRKRSDMDIPRQKAPHGGDFGGKKKDDGAGQG